jgi:hypothetical protein
MLRLLASPATTTLALLLAVAMPAQASQPSPEEAPRQAKQRCDRLIEFYDRYGAGRSQHSDGKRNHKRLGAEIDCDNGDLFRGIEAMEVLLRDKKFKVPSRPLPSQA